jgi:hypothetical protein
VPRALVLGLLLTIGSGCAHSSFLPPITATSTEAEISNRCVQTGGWWRPDELMGGHCEYEAPGMP